MRNLTHNSSEYSTAAQDETDKTPTMFLEEMNLNIEPKWDTDFFFYDLLLWPDIVLTEILRWIYLYDLWKGAPKRDQKSSKASY